jgi:ABC-2 type transport system ATP-binding protein
VGRRAIRDILNQLTGTGVTVFINSHLLSEVESFCDYVAILRKGRLAVEGKISNLLAGGGYRVVVSSVPDSASAELRRSGATFLPAEASGLVIQVPTRDEANAVIDLVRAAGGFIESMAISTNSLEDLFIQATSEQAA